MDNTKLQVTKRGFIRTQVTKNHTTVSENIDSMDHGQKLTILARFKLLEKDIKDLDGQIEQGLLSKVGTTNEEFQTEIEKCYEYGQKISEGILILEENIKSSCTGRPNSEHAGGPRGQSVEIHSQLKRPTVPLPVFNGTDDENLESFLLNFESTTEKYAYSSYDKMLLLKQQVHGRGELLLNSLEISEQNFESAKDLLVKAFASPLTQKFKILKQLSELKLNYDSEPFEYISKTRSLSEAFKSLKITTDHVLQYFIWEGLNDTFKSQLVQITNHSRPSLDEIREHFFEASERYSGIVKKFKEKKNVVKPKPTDTFNKEYSVKQKTVGLAADVKFDVSKGASSNAFKSCSLCRDEGEGLEHPVHKCPKFLSPKDKVDRLNKIGACTRCANTTHTSEDCRFRFNKKCIKCQNWHFSFLCQFQSERDQVYYGPTKSESTGSGKTGNIKVEKDKKVKDKKSKEIATSTVWVELKSSFSCNKAILPTFTGYIGENLVKCLKDTGCQANFVAENIVKQNNLKIIKEDISLTVNGFNVAKDYHCYLVEVPMKLGEKVFAIEAICVPSLNIKLNIPGLSSLVKRFTDLGFEMADKSFYNDKLLNNCDVELILGTDSLHVLGEETVSFGNPVPSLYYNTSFGIMLVGNIDRIFSNLKFLHEVPSDSSAYTGTGGSIENKIEIDFGPEWKAEHDSLAPIVEVDFENTEDVNSLVDSVEPFVSAHPSILDERGALLDSELEKATAEILNEQCNFLLTDDTGVSSEDVFSEHNVELVNYALKGTTRDQEGRLVMPLLWNGKVCHLLGKNLNLSKQILMSNYKKLSKKEGHLLMVDKVFRDQEKIGVIEKVENFEKFLVENPNHSFLPHMGVFKLDRDTTKCRVVYLSNLCEKDPTQTMTVSHNQAIFAGPCLNPKISTALLLLRFDKFLLTFDLVKAFLNISLNEIDQNRLMFLWFKNVEKNNLEIVGFRSKRLPFGLRCSPTLLMLALYKILIVDAVDDPIDLRELKRTMYHRFYVDNGAISAQEAQELCGAFKNLNEIFNPYGFKLQQYATNNLELQQSIDVEQQQMTDSKVKLFGLLWDREADTLSTKPLHLSESASTKREVLKTVASNFDVFGFSGPILNRARLFLHDLQCQKELGWDLHLSDGQLNEWHKISHQVNSSPTIDIKRFVGKQSDNYRLVAFTDSSQCIYGTVIYIQNLETLEVNFLLSKNKIVSNKLKSKSIPSLEFNAILLGTQMLIDLYNELCGPTSVKPVNISGLQLYSDSLVSLHWLNSYSNKLDKMSKRSVFVMNRLHTLNKLCEVYPVRFSFISGVLNPADFVTRPTSYKILIKSNYISGPKFLAGERLISESEDGICDIIMPNPKIDIKSTNEEVNCNLNSDVDEEKPEKFYSDLIIKYSSFSRLCGVFRNVFKFIHRLKAKIGKHDYTEVDEEGVYQRSLNFLLLNDQRLNFPEIVQYFSKSDPKKKDIPNLVTQLNIFPDKAGILRVKSKFEGKENQISKFPILLPKNSALSTLIIKNIHARMSHAGCYSVLSELRKEFYIPHSFSVVRKELHKCVVCKRFNNKTVKLNQSSYRDFRLDPPQIPFRSIFIDHLGPYWVNINEKKCKVWILLVTCLFTRGINLKICWDLSVKSFLQAFQQQIFDFGMPSICLSDAGSQIVAGGKVVLDFLKDAEAKKFLDMHSIHSIEFQHYFTGNHELGSLVEICVKMTKRLIFGTLKNVIFPFDQFEFLVAQTIHLVNKRPIAFRESLRDAEVDYLDPITPEVLIKGYEIPSLNIIPRLQPAPEDDPDWVQGKNHVKAIKHEYSKLIEGRKRLYKIYYGEFLNTLISQATDRKDRYKPVKHERLGPGDIILLKEPLCKPSSYPLAIVKDIQLNDLGEVTGVVAYKGKTRESVKRHVSSVIPLLKDSLFETEENVTPEIVDDYPVRKGDPDGHPQRRIRKAAIKCRDAIKKLSEEDRI